MYNVLGVKKYARNDEICVGIGKVERGPKKLEKNVIKADIKFISITQRIAYAAYIKTSCEDQSVKIWIKSFK